MFLPLKVISGIMDVSEQLAVYSAEASLVAEVLPLNYTRIFARAIILYKSAKNSSIWAIHWVVCTTNRSQILY